MQPALNTRLQWIDYAKGIGIFLVVFGHVLRSLIESNLANSPVFHYIHVFVYSFHMPLFFIIAGYFFLDSVKNNGSGFVLKKLKRLIYPFIIWSLLQTTIEILLNRFTNHKIPSSEILTCLILPRAQFWFLFALFFIHYINFLAYQTNSHYALIATCLIWLVFFLLHIKLEPFAKIFQYLIFFNIGVYFSKQQQKFLPLLEGRWTLILILILAIAEYFYFICSPKTRYLYSLLFLFTGTLGSVTVMNISKKIATINWLNFFDTWGKASLEICLVHILAASGTRIILVSILKITNPIVNVILETTFGIIIPLLIYSFCSKRSYLSWIFKFPEQKNQ